jgi:hypothetical protein
VSIANHIRQIYKPPVCAAPADREIRDETVPEFVAYFYEFARDEAAMVRLLDRALKERYGSGRTRG